MISQVFSLYISGYNFTICFLKFDNIKVVEAQNNEALVSGKMDLKDLLKQKQSLEIRIQSLYSMVTRDNIAQSLSDVYSIDSLTLLTEVSRVYLENKSKDVRSTPCDGKRLLGHLKLS